MGLFVRGDANRDGGVNVADAIAVLGFLFIMGTPPLSCPDAGDANDSGGVDVADAIYLLTFLFSNGPVPPEPYPDPGPDPTPDPLVCP